MSTLIKCTCQFGQTEETVLSEYVADPNCAYHFPKTEATRFGLLGKLEAMRSEVRAHEDNGAESVRVLVRAVDALTFVVIGMLEAEGPCGNQDVTGRTCARKTNHEHHHRSVDGWIW